MKFAKKELIAALCLTSTLAISNTAHSSDQTGPWTTVEMIYARSTGVSMFVYFANGGMPGCYNDKGGYLGEVNDDTDQIYSTVLSALVAEREVQVFFNFTGATEGWGMCRIEAIHIR